MFVAVARVAVVHIAWPALMVSVAQVAIAVPLLLKSTVPVGVAPPVTPATVAVRATLDPGVALTAGTLLRVTVGVAWLTL